MLQVFVVIHILITVGLIALILLHKSEGNAAGGGFSVSATAARMQPRSRPNPLSRATGILGIGFFVTSLGIALLAKNVGPPPSLLDTPGVSSGSAPRVDEIATPTAEKSAAPAPETSTPAAAPAVPVVPTVPKN